MAKAKQLWSLNQVEPNVHTITFNADSRQSELLVLLVSDLHWDNPHCDRKLLKSHFAEARDKNAVILSFGDFFCAMQGKYDKRADKSSVLPEHQHGDYLDRLVNTAADWFLEFGKNLALIGQGNHETAVRARHETCLVDRLTGKLRDRGAITKTGGYSGWVRFKVNRAGRSHNSLDLWYHHGFGGGGAVTQGKIDFNRYGNYIDADIIASGHVHYKECFPTKRAFLSMQDVPRVRTQWCVRCGTYKDEWGAGEGGFHIEKGRGPRRLGGYWLRIKLGSAGNLTCDFREAGEF